MVDAITEVVDSTVEATKVVNPQMVEAIIEVQDWETVNSIVVDAPVGELAVWSLAILVDSKIADSKMVNLKRGCWSLDEGPTGRSKKWSILQKWYSR